MKFTLRDYQQAASDAALRFFRSRSQHNGILVLPTGAGKSLVIADIAHRLGGNILVFQPSKEILEQNFNKLKSYGEEDCSIYSASFNSKEISRITFATIGSVKSHMEDFNHFHYIIVDECHGVNPEGGMYKKFFDCAKRKIIGLTATPYRLFSAIQYQDSDEKVVYRPREPRVDAKLEALATKVEERERIMANPRLFCDTPVPAPVPMTRELEDYINKKKEFVTKSIEFDNNIDQGVIEAQNVCILKFLTRMRPRVFHEVIYKVEIQTLLQRGYLSKLNYFDMTILPQDGLKRNSTGMDFDERSLFSEFKRVNLQEHLVNIVKRLQVPKSGIPRRGILVFTRFLDESKRLCESIEGCEMISGETSAKERRRKINDFKSGKIQVLTNVGVLTTGFDYPELDTVVMARPTMSLAMWYQIVGRAIRPHESKESGWIVDLCGNIKRFGRVEDLQLTEYNPGEYAIQGVSDNQYKQLTNVYF